jgi:hypothetical protein
MAFFFTQSLKNVEKWNFDKSYYVLKQNKKKLSKRLSKNLQWLNFLVL